MSVSPEEEEVVLMEFSSSSIRLARSDYHWP